MSRLTKREARKWVQQHWAEFIYQSDCPDPCPEEAAEIWTDECDKIAKRMRRTLSGGKK